MGCFISIHAFELNQLHGSIGVNAGVSTFQHKDVPKTSALHLSPEVSVVYQFNRSQAFSVLGSVLKVDSSNDDALFYETAFSFDVGVGYQHRFALTRSLEVRPSLHIVNGLSTFTARYFKTADGFLEDSLADLESLYDTGFRVGLVLNANSMNNSRFGLGINSYFRRSFMNGVNSVGVGVLVKL